MRYEIALFTWYGIDCWTAEFDNHNDMFQWYKRVKHDIEDDAFSRDYIYKVKIKCCIDN